MQVRQEADVQHAVGFVEHHVLDLAEHRALGLDVVQQAARRGNQHLDPGFQGQGLWFHVHTPKHHTRPQTGVLGVGFDVVGHLVGQFTRGRQHQGAHRVARRRHAGVFVPQHLLQQRNRERRRLARARLRRPPSHRAQPAPRGWLWPGWGSWPGSRRPATARRSLGSRGEGVEEGARAGRFVRRHNRCLFGHRAPIIPLSRTEPLLHRSRRDRGRGKVCVYTPERDSHTRSSGSHVKLSWRRLTP